MPNEEEDKTVELGWNKKNCRFAWEGVDNWGIFSVGEVEAVEKD